MVSFAPYEHVQQQIVEQVLVIESFTPAPAVTFSAPAPVIKHVSFAPDDPARVDVETANFTPIPVIEHVIYLHRVSSFQPTPGTDSRILRNVHTWL